MWSSTSTAGASAGTGGHRRSKRLCEAAGSNSTRTITRAIAAAADPPGLLINASAVGYYGDRGDEELDESSPRRNRLPCRPLAGLGVGRPRSGIGQDTRRAPAPRDGRGCGRRSRQDAVTVQARPRRSDGQRGSQFWPWVAIDDVLGAIDLAIENPPLSGPVNVVAPQETRCAEFRPNPGSGTGTPRVHAGCRHSPARSRSGRNGRRAFAFLTKSSAEGPGRCGLQIQNPNPGPGHPTRHQLTRSKARKLRFIRRNEGLSNFSARSRTRNSAAAAGNIDSKQRQKALFSDCGSDQLLWRPGHSHLRVVIVGSSRWSADVKGKPGEPGASHPGHRLPHRLLAIGHERPGGAHVQSHQQHQPRCPSKALEAAGMAINLVMRVPAPLKSIADQEIRSASWVPANLAEGHGRVGRARSKHWRIAYASAKEVDSHLTLLAHAGAISRNGASEATHAFDEVRAIDVALAQSKILTGNPRTSRPGRGR